MAEIKIGVHADAGEAAAALGKFSGSIDGLGARTGQAAETLSSLNEQLDAVRVAQDGLSEAYVKDLDLSQKKFARYAEAKQQMAEYNAGVTGGSIPANVNLSKTIGKLAQDAVQLTGNVHNLKASYAAMGDASSTAADKMMAGFGMYASAAAGLKNLGEIGDGASKAYGMLSGNLSGTAAGLGSIVAVGAAAILVTKEIADKTRELAEEEMALEVAMARAEARTDHQKDAMKFLAVEMGTTVQGLKDQGIGLENINRLIKDDPYGKLAKAVKEWRENVAEANEVHRSTADIMAAAEKAGAMATEKATAAILEQHGVISDFDYTAKLAPMLAAYDATVKKTGDATLANKLFGDEILKLRDQGKDLGAHMPKTFIDTATAIEASKAATDHLAGAMKNLEAHRTREKAQVAENTVALAAQAAAANAAYDAMIGRAEKYNAEIAKIRSQVFTSDLTSGDNEKVAVDSKDPAIKAAAERLKAQGQSGASAAQALLEGDLTKLAAIASKMREEFERFTGPSAVSQYAGSAAAGGKAANLAQSINDVINMLRQNQTPATTSYGPAAGSYSPASTPSGGVVTTAQSTDWDRVTTMFAEKTAKLVTSGFGGGGIGGAVKFVLTAEGGKELATIVAKNLQRNNLSLGNF